MQLQDLPFSLKHRYEPLTGPSTCLTRPAACSAMAAPGSGGCLTHVPQNNPVYALALMQGLHMCRKLRESMALFTIYAYQPGASLCVCHSLSQRQHMVFPKACVSPKRQARAPGGPDSHLTPPRCEDNKFLTRTCGARRGCVSGAADRQVPVEASCAGWRAARLPWPPATTPASRRAGLPDTSLPCVTGHWVVSRARKELRGLLGTGRPP